MKKVKRCNISEKRIKNIEAPAIIHSEGDFMNLTRKVCDKLVRSHSEPIKPLIVSKEYIANYDSIFRKN